MKIHLHTGYAGSYWRIVRNPGQVFIDIGRRSIEIRWG
jgi:hypothetical protein